MPRELKSAEEIRNEVSRLVNESREVIEDGQFIEISRPMQSEPDPLGCNWGISTVNSPGHVGLVQHKIRDVQARWNMKD